MVGSRIQDPVPLEDLMRKVDFPMLPRIFGPIWVRVYSKLGNQIGPNW